MRNSFLTILVLGSAVFASGQQATLVGPVQAIAFDAPSHSIRAVTGYPGSALFGLPVVASVDFASVAPHQNFAIAVRRGADVLATALDTAQGTIIPLDGLAANPDGIAWSADGSLAVLYSLSGNWMQLVSGLPSNPHVAGAIDLSQLAGALSAVAVDAQGKRIAVAMTGQPSSVFFFDTTAQSFSPALETASPIALGFSRDNASLFVIDSSAGELIVLNVTDLSTQSIALAGLANPIAVRGSEDPANPQLVYVASGSDQILRCYDLKAQQVVSDTALQFAPTGIEAFGRTSFLIAGRSRIADPLWLFVTGPVSGAFFVPAIQPDSPRIEPVANGSRTSASMGGAR